MYLRLIQSLLFICTLPLLCPAQQRKYELSEPVDLKQEGVNKVLCMKNGSTMLFHFQLDKGITVKIFDSLHKEVASNTTSTRIFDLSVLKAAAFKGLYDINSEGVLFMGQEHLSKYGLVRLRFNSANGTLIEESLVDESKSIRRPMKFFLMKEKEQPGYAIFFFADDPAFEKCDAYVRYYSDKHEMLKQVSIDVDRKRYDAAEAIGAEIQSNGICISLALSKLLTNRTVHAETPGASAEYDHDLAVYFVTSDSGIVKKKIIDVTKNIISYYSLYNYNATARALNLMLVSYVPVVYKMGLTQQPGALITDLFFKVDETNMSAGAKVFKNEMANAYLQQSTGKNAKFEGMPVRLFTNENGLSTLVSEYCMRQAYGETRQYPRSTYFGDICITQFDDDGNEIWGTVLPKTQYLKGIERYYYTREISAKWQDQVLMGDVPEIVYDRQFLSTNVYSKNRNFYIIYNDADKNLQNSIRHRGDVVYNFTQTNTFCYKIDPKKEVTKNYLFGAPSDDYKASLIEGADFDEQRGIYSALVQYKKGENIELRMGWSQLE